MPLSWRQLCRRISLAKKRWRKTKKKYVERATNYTRPRFRTFKTKARGRVFIPLSRGAKKMASICRHSVPFPARLRPIRPPCPHLLSSNECPSDAEAERIQQSLTLANSRLAHLLPASSQPSDNTSDDGPRLSFFERVCKSRLNDFIHSHKAILSPVRRLPIEIIQRILRIAAADIQEVDDYAPMAPWAVGHICRLWRAAALSYPVLWTNLIFRSDMQNEASVQLDALDEIFRRMKGSLFHWALIPKGWPDIRRLRPSATPHPLFDRLFKRSAQWEDVRLWLTPVFFNLFKNPSTSKDGLPSLRKLSVRIQMHAYPGHFSIRYFACAPKLKEVELSARRAFTDYDMNSRFDLDIPWLQLERLHFLHPIPTAYVQLKSICDAGIRPGSRSIPGMPTSWSRLTSLQISKMGHREAFPPLEQSRFLFPNVEDITIELVGALAMGRVLSNIVAPKLKKLAVRVRLGSTWDATDKLSAGFVSILTARGGSESWAPGVDAPSANGTTSSESLSYPHSPLTHLRLAVHEPFLALYPILIHAPLLTHLASARPIPQDDLAKLASDPAFLPFLTELKFHYSDEPKGKFNLSKKAKQALERVTETRAECAITRLEEYKLELLEKF